MASAPVNRKVRTAEQFGIAPTTLCRMLGRYTRRDASQSSLGASHASLRDHGDGCGRKFLAAAFLFGVDFYDEWMVAGQWGIDGRSAAVTLESGVSAERSSRKRARRAEWLSADGAVRGQKVSSRHTRTMRNPSRTQRLQYERRLRSPSDLD